MDCAVTVLVFNFRVGAVVKENADYVKMSVLTGGLKSSVSRKWSVNVALAAFE